MRLGYLRRFESGRGLPHSKTLSRRPGMSDSPRAHRSADSLVRAVSVSTLLGDGRAAGLSRLPMPYRTRDFDRVFHLVSACFTWFQLSGKKNRNGKAENWRFQLRGTLHLLERSAGFSRVWCGGVAPGCSLLRLVAATGKKLEEASVKREISTAQRSKAPNTNIQAPENVQMPITKTISLQRYASVLALGNWCFNGTWMLAFGASWHSLPFWTHFCSISVPSGRRRFTLFHLVALTSC